MKSIFLLCCFFWCSCYALYYSQCGQDQFVQTHYFPGYSNGTFVDIGAHDGITINNTYYFEQVGWNGICIEPIPDVFEQLQKNRKCICIQGCVTDNTGDCLFAKCSNNSFFSGLFHKYDKTQLDLLQKKHSFSFELINVKCYLLNDLLEANNIKHINFLSIDCEGGELDILATIDFSKYQIDVITVEDNFNDPRYRHFFESKGFKFSKRLGQDVVFVNKNFTTPQ